MEKINDQDINNIKEGVNSISLLKEKNDKEKIKNTDKSKKKDTIFNKDMENIISKSYSQIGEDV